MRDYPLPPHAFFKRQARQTILYSIRPVLAISAIVLAAQLAALFFQVNFGGVLNYYQFNASDYASSTTGIWLKASGVIAILRMDAADTILVFPMSFRQMIVFVLANLFLFLILTPLMMGALEQFQAILSNKFSRVSELFRWYADLHLTAKAVGLGFVLSFVKWAVRAVCVAPGLALFVWAANGGRPTVFLILSYLLLLAGAAAAYWVFTLVLPARYMLACKPETSVVQALSEGVRATRDRKTDYFQFRLSFLLWYLADFFSYGIMGLFVTPYAELSNLFYLRGTVPEEEPNAPAEL